jgi:4-deoxy-L-threo-5-hexosulose-uronate ketol-isomerase
MEIRPAVHPEDFRAYDTARLRRDFLVQNLFTPGQARLVYSHVDRMIAAGLCPVAPLALGPIKETGTEYFLERRELGVINVGPAGRVKVDGQTFDLAKAEGLYVGQGAREVLFESQDPQAPARFYALSGPAHQAYPAAKIAPAQAEPTTIGSPEAASVRTIRKYIHPGGVRSCQLVMGVTTMAPGSVWNSMPCHTHPRRMEVYFYFDLAPEAVLFHFMGRPSQTRHLVVRNEEAVISPSWSIHTGAGTSGYAFIWGMLGENQTFSDMDAVAMAELA